MKYIRVNNDTIDISSYQIIRKSVYQKDGVNHYQVLFLLAPDDIIPKYSLEFNSEEDLDNFLFFVDEQIGTVEYNTEG